ncbi:MAG: winged helix-turn-helix domain-containing protein [Colwellia sp.]|nr:winged helix-turn-helix domain-containing protein [Colwellia sp.]
MAVQYWVGDFFVDLSRNQVTQKEQSQTIAPKALAVLTYLAENQGRVVSYDELLSNVWPDTVVTPNTLQRSIAQLRKVLGEDSKLQSYIKTHAKQGYSLECDVRWHVETEAKLQVEQNTAANLKAVEGAGKDLSIPDRSVENDVTNTQVKSESDTADKVAPARSVFRLTSVVIGIVMLGFLGFWGFNTLAPEQTSPLTFDKLRSLTATDDKEYAASYSPDGEFIVFHRYIDKLCMNNLWAKNTTTQQETQLTKNLGTYGRHSFSIDGKKLVYISSQDCNKPIPQKRCYNLMSLDFKKALASPQPSTLMVQCKNSQLRNPQWLDNDNIAVMQNFGNRWKLISYSISDNKSTILFELKEGNLIAFDYSVRENLIAVISVDNVGRQYIKMLEPNGQILSSHIIEFPAEFSKFRYIAPVFDPLNKQLVFGYIRQLFTLSYDGKINRISLPLEHKIEAPSFHPNGKRLLLIKKRYDSDIASVPLVDSNKNQSSLLNTNAIYSILARSTLGEENALFQPKGQLISFTSERSGEDQLWITSGNDTQLISTFPSNTLILGSDWAADGKSLLVNANGMLTEVFLDRQQVNSSFTAPVTRLFQWDSESNTALLMIRTAGESKFVELNLDDLAFRIVSDKKIAWAQKSQDGRLIYTDLRNQFWQPGPVEDQLIEKLVGQASSKRFVIKKNVIFGINKENRLWSYDLDSESFEILRELPDNVDYLTDINQTHAMVELQISAKKEVVELSLSE